MSKTALIIGASRGLGLAILEELLKRGWSVTATTRSPLGKTHAALTNELLDITDDQQIAQLKSRIGIFDLLFVNAGVANKNGMAETVGQIARDEFTRVMETNALSPMKVVEHLAANVRPGGTIGVMSSGQGSVADNESGGNDVYRASKAALNMMMRSYSVRDRQHALLLLAPGWIKTDMGGDGARFTIDETIGDIVNTITTKSPPGLRFVDRFNKSVRW